MAGPGIPKQLWDHQAIEVAALGGIGYCGHPGRFSLEHDAEKARPALDAGWVTVSRLREALRSDLRLA
jgi:hypothetical protein